MKWRRLCFYSWCSLVAVGIIWALAAIWLNLFPLFARIAFILFFLAAVCLIARRTSIEHPRILPWIAIVGSVIAGYLLSSPPMGLDWAPEFARMPRASWQGDKVTVYDIRNFSYKTEHDFTPRWENRTIDLNAVVGADLFLTHWGVPLIAHSMVSFRFADGTYLATSIEARRTANQEFSAFRGFFREFEVAFLVSDERDVVRLRTNYRQKEEVYLYRTRLKAADARKLLEYYFERMNAVRERPEWYNALTENCSTPIASYLAKSGIGGISLWDWRGIFDGDGDKMLYELGDLEGDTLPFNALKTQAHINQLARFMGDAPDFSEKIRAGRAGFKSP